MGLQPGYWDERTHEGLSYGKDIIILIEYTPRQAISPGLVILYVIQ